MMIPGDVVDLVVHNTPVDKSRYRPPVKHQAITDVRGVVDSKLRRFPGPFSCCEGHRHALCGIADKLSSSASAHHVSCGPASVSQAA
jgi:hypothetical protein